MAKEKLNYSEDMKVASEKQPESLLDLNLSEEIISKIEQDTGWTFERKSWGKGGLHFVVKEGKNWQVWVELLKAKGVRDEEARGKVCVTVYVKNRKSSSREEFKNRLGDWLPGNAKKWREVIKNGDEGLAGRWPTDIEITEFIEKFADVRAALDEIDKKIESVGLYDVLSAENVTKDDRGVEKRSGEGASDHGERRAWLLVWNPEHWKEWDYPALCLKTDSTHPYDAWWSSANQNPQENDEVYLYKAGKGPKGIMAHGTVKEPYDKRTDSENKGHIRVSFDCVLDVNNQIISLEELKKKFPDQTWAPQSSGIEIESKYVDELGELWNKLLEQKTPMKGRNLIYFGAPGTGKSYVIDTSYKNSQLWSSKERVTFHPDYSYAGFVGTYKPYMKGSQIEYKFVPGPFMRVLVNALRNHQGCHLLVIEEINRANPAAVFGDVFQLLDRDSNGESFYAISPSQDLAKFLYEALTRRKVKTQNGGFDEEWWWLTTDEPMEGSPEDIWEKIRSLKIPSNMNIWATMNSADQGVFPMDTAFKRRWSFEYVGIDDGETKMSGKLHEEWNYLRKRINEKLVSLKVNEDKCMGPFFLSESDLADVTAFVKTFKSKVLMYLFEDAARQKRHEVFAENCRTLSQIFSAMDGKDRDVFKDKDINDLLNQIIIEEQGNTGAAVVNSTSSEEESEGQSSEA